MNLIDFIHNNIFLKKLFPNGIENNEVMIGKFSFDFSNCEIDFHIRQKPSIEVQKYGVWGENYNTIVIRTSGLIGEEVCIQNWRDRGFQELKISQADDKYIIFSSNGNFKFSMVTRSLSFQSMSVYINFPDE